MAGDQRGDPFSWYLEMEIYICGNRLFMIVETPIDFDWESAMAKLATYLDSKNGKTCIDIPTV